MIGRRTLAWLVMGGIALAGIAWLLPRLQSEQSFWIPTAAQAREMQGDFARLLADPVGAEGPSRMESHGFAITRRGDSVRIAEPSEDCRGRGTYVVREGADSPVMLAAPHRAADRHTGTLAARLFANAPFAALATNSAPRRATEACPGGGDVARESTHPFTAFALAFAKHRREARIVQLHGFDRDKRSGRAREAAVILSNGTRSPDDSVASLADCLTLALAGHPALGDVLVFPHDTAELGALGNAQAQALRDAGHGGFIHLEMSAQLRELLVRDDAALASFGACLEVAR